MIDWALVGSAIAAALSGAGGWFMGRGGRKRAEARDTAAVKGEIEAINLLREEVQRLNQRMVQQDARIDALEASRGYMGRHIIMLERVLLRNDIQPPPFDLDAAMK